MQFEYTAKSTGGLSQSGSMTADSTADVRLRLRDRGLYPLSVAPASATKKPKTTEKRRMQRSRISKADVLLLTNQLAIMSDAGVELAEALQIVAEQCTKEDLQRILNQIHNDVSAGMAVSDALRKHTKVFGEAYVASVSAGEASGTLTDVLQRLAELLQHEMRLQTAIRSVIAYPIVLVGVAGVVMTC